MKLSTIGKEIYINEYQLRLSNSLRLQELFNNDLINENDDDREHVIKLINTDQWEEHNPQQYRESIMKSKHPEMLTNYSTSDYDKMKLFKLKDYDIGFALKLFNGKYQEIVAVFNNSGIGGIGKPLIQSAIKHGGCYLDHFDGFLTDLYQSSGFVEYKREPFNPEFDPDFKFRNKYGERDIIYRKLQNC